MLGLMSGMMCLSASPMVTLAEEDETPIVTQEPEKILSKISSKPKSPNGLPEL